MNLAERIVREIPDPLRHWRIPEGASGRKIVARLEVALSPGVLTTRTRWAIARYVDQLPPDTSLEERVREVARVILSSPGFVLH